MKKLLMGLVAGLAIVGMTSTANAVVLVPASGFMPLSGAVLGALAAPDLTVTNTYNLLGSTVLGTVTQNVYFGHSLTDGSSTFTGVLFTYQFTRIAAGDSVGTVSVSTYAEDPTVSVNFATDHGGTLAPTDARRSADGSTIFFDWGLIPVGTTTDLFYVQTNLPYVQPGVVSLIGAKTDTFGNFYSPTATPEPASAMLLGTGLLGLLGFRRKMSK